MNTKRKMLIKEWIIGILTTVLVISTFIGSAVYLKPYLANAAETTSVSKTNNSNTGFYSYFINNMNFKAYFKDSQGNELTTMNVTTADETYLYLYIEVLKEGYFNGEITISDGNFDIDSEIVDEKISSIQGNTITVNQVNNGEPQEFKVKINRKTAKEYDLNLLEKETKINISGIYANVKKEKEFEEELTVKLVYESPYIQEQSDLTLSVLTNKIEEIDGEEKRILQIQITSSLEGNQYPIKNTNIELTAPKETEKVYVYTRGTNLTNGKSSCEELNEKSYTYNEQTNTVEIDIANEIQETENGEQVVTWNDSGTDKLIITYILPENSEIEQTINATSKIDLYDGSIENHETTVLKATNTIKVEAEVNGIITAQMTTEDESIYKGKIYSGEEKEISTIIKVGINYAGIEDKIELEGINTTYEEIVEDEQTQETYTANILNENLKNNKTIIQRNYLEKVLGEEGILTVKVGEVKLAEINKQVLENLDDLNQSAEEKKINQTDYATIKLKEDTIEIEYNIDKQYRVDIEIENPEEEGELYITNTYSIVNEYTREELKNINNLKIESKLITEKITEKLEANIDLEETTINANFKIVNNTLNENKITKDVEFLVLFRNDSEEDDLYSNPYIEIELPEEIKEITIKSANLVYEDGLSIASYEIYENEQGKKIIKVGLEGTQTTHQIDTETKGTYVIINTNIILGEIEESKETDVNLKIVNRQEGITYTKELQKTMKYIKTVEETQMTKITEISVSETSTIDDVEADGKLTVLKTASVEEGETVKEREIIKYKIYVRNNTTTTLENITITDELPEEVTYVRYNTGGGFSNGYIEDTETTLYEKKEISIDAGETQEFEYCVIVNKDNTNIGKNLVSNEATISMLDSAEEFKTNTYTNIIEEGKVEISIVSTSNVMSYFTTGLSPCYLIKIKNLTDSELTDVVIKDQLIEELTYCEGYILGKNSSGSFSIYADDTTQDNITYDDISRTVEFNVETLKAGEEKAAYLEVTINEDATTKYLENTASVEIESEEYIAFPETIRQEIKNYEISLENNIEGVYITEGESFIYTVTLKNLGDTSISGAITAELPDGITGESIYYSIETGDTSSSLDTANHTDVVDLSDTYSDALNGVVTENEESSDSEETEENEEAIYYESKVNFFANLKKNSVLTAKIYVVADMLEDDVEEKEITTSISFLEKESNGLYNIIIKSDRQDDSKVNDNEEDQTTYVDDGDYYTRDNTITNETTDETTDEIVNEITSQVTNETSNENTITAEETNIDGQNTTVENKNDENNAVITEQYSSISGQVYLDFNENGTKDSNEEKIENIKVRLLDVSTNNYLATTVTDSYGYYEFMNLNNGIYMVAFEYDNTKYKITEYQKNGVSFDVNSDVVKSIVNEGIGYTDTLTLNEEDKENIDMGLIYTGTFDFKLEKTVTSITVINDSGSKTTLYDNTSLAKVEISSKLLSSSTVLITYNITVTNEGEVTGYVDKIVDYLPDDLTFDSSTNSNWYESNGLLESHSLSGQAIGAGESKTIELKLMKTMTTSNTGNVSNSAEIREISNSESLDDIDSTPNNKDISEDDYSTANVMISVSTGILAKCLSITSLVIIISIIVIIILIKIKKIDFIYWKERRR